METVAQGRAASCARACPRASSSCRPRRSRRARGRGEAGAGVLLPGGGAAARSAAAARAAAVAGLRAAAHHGPRPHESAGQPAGLGGAAAPAGRSAPTRASTALRTARRRRACRATARRPSGNGIRPTRAATQISRAAPWRLTIIFEPSANSISSTPPSLRSTSASTPLASMAASSRARARSASASNSVSSMGPANIAILCVSSFSAPLILVLAAGCGQKGPLYLRDNPPPGVKPLKPKPLEPVPYPATRGEKPKASNGFRLPQWRALRRAGAARRDRAALRHALLRLLARGDRAPPTASSAPRSQGRAALVCYSVKANSNLAVLALLAAARRGLRHRLRRRAGARARGRRRAAQDAVLRRRQDRGRDRRGARARASLPQPRVRGGARARRRGGAAARPARAGRLPRQSGCRRAAPIRTSRPACARTSSAWRTTRPSGSIAGPRQCPHRARRDRLPHRLAARAGRALRGCRRDASSRWRTG